MALIDKDERKILLGVGIGMAGLTLLRQVLPSFGGLGRPLAKAAIKSGINFYDKSRESLSRFAEVMEDLAAEARQEIADERRATAGPVPVPPPVPSGEPSNGGA